MATFDSIPPEGITNVDEWLACRLGKLTASRAADAFRRTKTGWSKERENYKLELICERLTGMAKPVFQSEAMIEGQQREHDALARYAAHCGAKIETPWFVAHPTIKFAGCSPDGHVGDDGMVQIKAPLAHTHLRTLLTKEIDPDYIVQMNWELACNPKRQWNDYVSYCPTFPQPLRMFTRRIYRDDVLIAGMEEMARAFLAEIEDTIKSLGITAPFPQNWGQDFKGYSEIFRDAPHIESQEMPDSAYSGIDSLIASGAVKRGMK